MRGHVGIVTSADRNTRTSGFDHHCAASRASPRPRNVEEYLLERFAAVADEQTLRGVVVLDAAALHDDHALAQTLDLAHVVGGEQHRGATLLAKAFEMAAHPVGGIGIERRGRLVEQKDLW